jgi:hypothetical protein
MGQDPIVGAGAHAEEPRRRPLALATGGSRMPGMPLIRRLDELGRGDIDVAGGKGANLGELVRAGLPVPPGFVLTTAAYRRFVASTRRRDGSIRGAVGPDPRPLR